eukprot:362555-Chlamydomonas_euryale.AAC.10
MHPHLVARVAALFRRVASAVARHTQRLAVLSQQRRIILLRRVDVVLDGVADLLARLAEPLLEDLVIVLCVWMHGWMGVGAGWTRLDLAQPRLEALCPAWMCGFVDVSVGVWSSGLICSYGSYIGVPSICLVTRLKLAPGLRGYPLKIFATSLHVAPSALTAVRCVCIDHVQVHESGVTNWTDGLMDGKMDGCG